MADSGIEFLIELEAKLDGAIQASSAMRKLMQDAEKADKALAKSGVVATGAFAKVRGAIAGAAKDFNVAGGKWLTDFGRSAASTFTGMFAATAVWDSLKAGVSLVADLTGELFKAAGEAERTEFAFRNMMGEEAGGALLGGIDRITRHTEFTDGPLKAMTQNLMDAGFAGENLANAMSATFDVAARSPDKMAGASGAIGAFERLMLTGTADARTLRALKVSPKAFYEQMSKDMGIGQEAVKKKLQEGKFKTQDVVNSVFKAIAAKNGGVLGAAGADMATTFSARMERMKDVVPNIFEEMNKTGGFKRLSDALGELADELTPGGQTGDRIVKALSSTFDSAADYVTKIDWAAGAYALVDTLGKALELAKAAADVFGSFASGYNKAQNVVRGILSFGMADSVEVERNKEVTAEYHASAEGKRMAEQRRRFLEWKDARRFGPGLVTPEMKTTGTAAADGLVKGLDAGRSRVEKAAAGLGSASVAATKGPEGIDAKSPSRKFAELGRLSAEGYGQGLELAAGSLGAGGLMDGMAKGPIAAGARSVSVSTPITIHLHGSETSPDQIREIIRIEVPSSILGALEQLGLQTGAA